MPHASREAASGTSGRTSPLTASQLPPAPMVAPSSRTDSAAVTAPLEEHRKHRKPKDATEEHPAPPEQSTDHHRHLDASHPAPDKHRTPNCALVCRSAPAPTPDAERTPPAAIRRTAVRTTPSTAPRHQRPTIHPRHERRPRSKLDSSAPPAPEATASTHERR